MWCQTCSAPFESAFAPGVGQSHQQDGDENQRFDEREQTEPVKSDSPRVKKHGFDIKDDKHQCKHVVADVELNPGPADRLHAGLVGELPLTSSTARREKFVGDQGECRNRCGNQQKSEEGVIAGQGEHERPRSPVHFGIHCQQLTPIESLRMTAQR